MKITDVKPYPITETESGESFLFVKVETDEGIFGVGEAAFLAMGRTVVEAINHTAKVVIGEDPFATEQLWQRMFRAGAAPADRVVCSALSAIDRICQNSGHKGKSALNSTHSIDVFKFNRLADRAEFLPKIMAVP